MTTDYEWAIVGAGPAGIAAIGQLLDHGVVAERLVWIDPDFAAGDFGSKWHAGPYSADPTSRYSGSTFARALRKKIADFYCRLSRFANAVNGRG